MAWERSLTLDVQQQQQNHDNGDDSQWMKVKAT